MSFDGVDIRGAKFSDDKSVKTLDIVDGAFVGAIYDENTTYNGKSFVEIYGECKNKPRSK